jgi:hypothetical protein
MNPVQFLIQTQIGALIDPGLPTIRSMKKVAIIPDRPTSSRVGKMNIIERTYHIELKAPVLSTIGGPNYGTSASDHPSHRIGREIAGHSPSTQATGTILKVKRIPSILGPKDGPFFPDHQSRIRPENLYVR